MDEHVKKIFIEQNKKKKLVISKLNRKSIIKSIFYMQNVWHFRIESIKMMDLRTTFRLFVNEYLNTRA